MGYNKSLVRRWTKKHKNTPPPPPPTPPSAYYPHHTDTNMWPHRCLYVCMNESYVTVWRYVCIRAHTHSHIFVFIETQIYINFALIQLGKSPWSNWQEYICLDHLIPRGSNNIEHTITLCTHFMNAGYIYKSPNTKPHPWLPWLWPLLKLKVTYPISQGWQGKNNRCHCIWDSVQRTLTWKNRPNKWKCYQIIHFWIHHILFNFPAGSTFAKIVWLFIWHELVITPD